MPPKMIDIHTILQAGIDPKTGLPVKFTQGDDSYLYNGMIKLLRIVDEQDAINRYKWYNLPDGLSGQLLERILYYRGQGMFFKFQDRFFFLPYALAGTIDVYGRYTQVTPLPFNGTSKSADDKPWITGLERKCLYEVFTPDDVETPEEAKDIVENSCVLLHDYCKQISQTVLPREGLNRPLLDVEAKMIPYMRTALMNSTGVSAMLIDEESQSASVQVASNGVEQCALNGKKYVSMVGTPTFQDLTPGAVARAEEFLLAMEGIDNFRLGLYGLDNGGLFQKKSQITDAQNAINDTNVGLIMQDGLTLRQEFCDIINSVWGLDIWCDVSETATGIDMDGNGIAEDEQDQSGTQEGEQPNV